MWNILTADNNNVLFAFDIKLKCFKEFWLILQQKSFKYKHIQICYLLGLNIGHWHP